MENLIMLKWFRYWQNNSGGYFKNPARIVYIQAEDEEQANEIAENNDIYFNGCADGFDCSCCGDRWSLPWDETEGTLVIDKEDLKNEMAEREGIPKIMIVPFNHEPIIPSFDNTEELGNIPQITFE